MTICLPYFQQKCQDPVSDSSARTAVPLFRMLQTWEQLRILGLEYAMFKWSTLQWNPGPTNWPDQPDHVSKFLELITGWWIFDHVQRGGNCKERELLFLSIWAPNILKLWFYVKLQLCPKQNVGKLPANHYFLHIFLITCQWFSWLFKDFFASLIKLIIHHVNIYFFLSSIWSNTAHCI